MLKSGKNIFQNPTTYLYVSGVVALTALIISIIAMFTNDCKKSGFGDFIPGTTNQYGSVSEGDVCDKINASDTTACLAGSQGLNSGLDICAQGLTCVNDPRNQSSSRGICEKNKNKKDNRCPTQPTPQPGQGNCHSQMCCNPKNTDPDDDCLQGFKCSTDKSLNGKCKDKSCHSPYTRKCVKRTGCSNNSCIDPHHGPQVAGAPPISPSDKCCPGLICENTQCVKKPDNNPCQGLPIEDCKKNTDCEISKEFGHPECVTKSDDSGSSGSGSSGSGSDIIINKKHRNIGGNNMGGPGSTQQNSTPPSAAPSTHHHSPPPSHSPSPSDSDDLTWLWITLGSVGALVLLGLIVFFVTRKPKMGFGRPRMTGFGRPYAR